MFLLRRGQLWLLAEKSPLRCSNLHTFPRSSTNQIRLELGNQGPDIEKRRPTGSFGSCTDPPILNFTSLAVSSSMMPFASLSERATLSSFATTRVSPARHAASASRSPGPVGAGQPVIGVDQSGSNASSFQGVLSGGEILFVRGYATRSQSVVHPCPEQCRSASERSTAV